MEARIAKDIFPLGGFRLNHVTFAALRFVRFWLVSGSERKIHALTPGTPENAPGHTVRFGPIADLHPQHGIVVQTCENTWGFCAFTSPDPRMLVDGTLKPAPESFRYVWCGYFESEAEAVHACREIDALANPPS